MGEIPGWLDIILACITIALGIFIILFKQKPKSKSREKEFAEGDEEIAGFPNERLNSVAGMLQQMNERLESIENTISQQAPSVKASLYQSGKIIPFEKVMGRSMQTTPSNYENTQRN